MALTAKQIADLNGAMEANRLANVGTVMSNLTDTAADVLLLQSQEIRRGSYTAVADDATADLITIDTGLTAIAGFIVQCYRSGVNLTDDAVITTDEGDLIITEDTTYVITADDVINWIAW